MPDFPAPAATAARAILGGLVRHAITAAGSALVAHGVATDGQAGALEPALIEWATGAILVGCSVCWATLRARLSHTRWAAAWAALTADNPDQPAN